MFGNKENAFFSIIASVCPLATLYDINRQGPPSDCIAFTNLDFESTIHTIKFLDGQFMFQNIRETPGMCVIFDVKKYTPGNNKYEDYGQSVMPLFSSIPSVEDNSLELYVNSGIHQLPIYSGLISQDTLTSIRNARDTSANYGGLTKKVLDTTLIIKIVDN